MHGERPGKIFILRAPVDKNGTLAELVEKNIFIGDNFKSKINHLQNKYILKHGKPFRNKEAITWADIVEGEGYHENILNDIEIPGNVSKSKSINSLYQDYLAAVEELVTRNPFARLDKLDLKTFVESASGELKYPKGTKQYISEVVKKKKSIKLAGDALLEQIKRDAAKRLQEKIIALNIKNSIDPKWAIETEHVIPNIQFGERLRRSSTNKGQYQHYLFRGPENTPSNLEIIEIRKPFKPFETRAHVGG